MPSPPRLSREPHILIVGCGDVGQRLASRLVGHFRVSGTVRSKEAAARLRLLGVTPILLDLDDPRCGVELVYPWVVHLVPPQPLGLRDERSRRLIGRLSGVQRLVYVSTSGVYGDRGGNWIDEAASLRPATARAIRRVDAEIWLRDCALSRNIRLSILRVPGIYARDRLPIERVTAGTPASIREEDVYTNHIHADDLAQCIEAALFKGRHGRIYHASDQQPMLMADYFDAVADALALPRPPRLSRVELERQLSPMQYSFMTESRRLSNRRLLEELGVQLQYPNVTSALNAFDLIRYNAHTPASTRKTSKLP